MTGFPTVDELRSFCAALATDHTNVELREVGRSRCGEPVELLTLHVADPQGSVLIIGQPHPNEPIGMVTIMTLCERLTSDSPTSNVTWHFVPCADPDGTKLNEGWFKGPFTREHYARNFYRPGSESQVEWTFPLDVGGAFSVNRPLPETQALMTVIEQTKPTVLASLHNAELGGAYFYASPGVTGLTDLCARASIPLHLGEPEFPNAEVLEPAVYAVPSGAQLYELATAFGIDPSTIVTGGNSLDYAKACGCDPTTVVIELPYWRDDNAADTRLHPSGESHGDLLARTQRDRDESLALLERLLEAASPLPDSPFKEAVQSFLAFFGTGYESLTPDGDHDRPATVAEVFSARDGLHSTRLRMLGMFTRALPAESPVRDEAEALLDRWSAESAADSNAEVIPVDDLVSVQIGAILAAVSAAHP